MQPACPGSPAHDHHGEVVVERIGAAVRASGPEDLIQHHGHGELACARDHRDDSFDAELLPWRVPALDDAVGVKEHHVAALQQRHPGLVMRVAEDPERQPAYLTERDHTERSRGALAGYVRNHESEQVFTELDVVVVVTADLERGQAPPRDLVTDHERGHVNPVSYPSPRAVLQLRQKERAFPVHRGRGRLNARSRNPPLAHSIRRWRPLVHQVALGSNPVGDATSLKLRSNLQVQHGAIAPELSRFPVRVRFRLLTPRMSAVFVRRAYWLRRWLSRLVHSCQYKHHRASELKAVGFRGQGDSVLMVRGSLTVSTKRPRYGRWQSKRVPRSTPALPRLCASA